MGKKYTTLPATLVVNSARAALLRIGTHTVWVPHTALDEVSIEIVRNNAYEEQYEFTIETWLLRERGIEA